MVEDHLAKHRDCHSATHVDKDEHFHSWQCHVQYKVLLDSFPMNGHTLGFCTWSQKLENFVWRKVSPLESKG